MHCDPKSTSRKVLRKPQDENKASTFDLSIDAIHPEVSVYLAPLTEALCKNTEIIQENRQRSARQVHKKCSRRCTPRTSLHQDAFDESNNCNHTRDFSSQSTLRSVARSLRLHSTHPTAEGTALILDFLRGIPLFSELSELELLWLTDAMTINFTASRVLVHEVPASPSTSRRKNDHTSVMGTNPTGSQPKSPTDGGDLAIDGSRPVASAALASPRARSAPEPKKGAPPASGERDPPPSPSFLPSVVRGAGPGPPHAIYVVLQGQVQLCLPPRRYEVAAKDWFGHLLDARGVAPGARYTTATHCALLQVGYHGGGDASPAPGPRERAIAGVLHRCDAREQQRCLDRLRDPAPAGRREPAPSARLFAGLAEELRGIARRLVPLRIAKGQYLIERGDDADAVFFIVSGAFACTQVLKRQPPRASSTKHLSRNSLTPKERTENGIAQDTKRGAIVEVATLTAGDFCGELELLDYDPNERPGEGVVWGEAYWREALLRGFSVGIDPAGALARVCPRAGEIFAREDKKSQLVSKNTEKMEHKNEGEKKEEGSESALLCPESVSITAPLSPCPSFPTIATVVDGNDDADKGGTNQDDSRSDDRISALRATLAEIPRARIASVYAKTPGMVYRLDYDACRALFSKKVIARLREYVRGYASNDDLRVVLEAQEKWCEYRAKIVGEMMREVRQPRR